MGSGASTLGSAFSQQPAGGIKGGSFSPPQPAPSNVNPYGGPMVSTGMPLAQPAPARVAPTQPAPAIGGKGGPRPSYFGGPLPSAPSYEQRVIDARRGVAGSSRAREPFGNLIRSDIDQRRDMADQRLARRAEMGRGKGGPFGARQMEAPQMEQPLAAVERPFAPMGRASTAFNDERIQRTQALIDNYERRGRPVPSRLLRRMQQLQRRKMLSATSPLRRPTRPAYSRRPQYAGGLRSFRP